MRKLRALALGLTTAITLPALASTSVADAATPAIKFTTWQADYMGTKVADTPITAAKLNGEFITITNTTAKAVNIGGYKVSDKGAKHIYSVPSGFTLGAKKSVILHTGQGKNNSANLYWGQAVKGQKPAARNGYIWNNDGDVATLKNSKGAVVFTCTYKKVASGRKAC